MRGHYKSGAQASVGTRGMALSKQEPGPRASPLLGFRELLSEGLGQWAPGKERPTSNSQPGPDRHSALDWTPPIMWPAPGTVHRWAVTEMTEII